jgi:hypothetical protein
MVELAGTGGQRIPRMIRGSVVVQRRRCGKATCRCADGESLHEATVLSYTLAGAGPPRTQLTSRVRRDAAIYESPTTHG